MTSSNRLRVGIIGAGSFANTHMEQFSHLDNVEVVAFCRRDPRKLAEMQKAWGVGLGFTDYNDMLASGDIDAVDIITPTDLHRQIAVDSAKAGKHILCDKPLALTASDCREMLQAAESAGVIHCTNFNQRGNTAVGRMKRYIDGGYIGDLIHANLWWGMTNQHGTRPEIMSWRFKREAGGGTVYELIHLFDMVRFLGGEVARVASVLNTADKRRPFTDVPAGMDVDVPDSSAFLLEYENGGYAVAHSSFVTRMVEPDGRTHARVEVSGSRGVIHTSGRHGLKGYSGEMRGALGELEPGASYPQPYERFVNACLAGDQAMVETSFVDGLRAAEIVDAVYKAWETKSWVDVERKA